MTLSHTLLRISVPSLSPPKICEGGVRFLATHACDVQPDAIMRRGKGKTIAKNSRAKSNVFLKLYCV